MIIKNLNRILAKSKTYILAAISNLEINNISISINIKNINNEGRDWLLEIPQRYSYTLTIDEDWISFIDGDTLTYYKGNLSKAQKYQLHLYKPKHHIYKQNHTSLLAIVHDDEQNLLLKKNLYFWDVDDPRIYTLYYFRNDWENMTLVF